MSNLKISQFANGGAIQTTDEIATNRGGVNTKVFVGSMAAEDAGDYTPTLSLADIATSGDVSDLVGLGSNVANFLSTPSSANLYAAVTGKTGNGGGLVFAQQPEIIGTTTNNDAAAGIVGEYFFSEILFGSAIALTTNVAANITSINLTAGDWDISASIGFDINGSATSIRGSINTTSATITTNPSRFIEDQRSFTTGQDQMRAMPSPRIKLASPATLYLVGLSIFSTGGVNAYGSLAARRAR